MVAAGLVCSAFLAVREPPAPEPVAVSLAVAVALGAPVAVRRLWPLSACAVVVCAAAVSFAARMIPDYAAPAPYACLVMVLYTVALAGRWEPLAAVSALAMLLAGQIGPRPLVLLALVAPWATGFYVKERRAFAARSAAQLAEQAVAEERLRIAREMHDIVAHSLGVITVQASIAAHVAEARPAEAGKTLGLIEETGRRALAEMRATLGVLRAPADLAPAPRLADLGSLAEHAASAGVEVRLDVADLPPLSPGLELAVYRIVQEAVTNVIKHAAPATCEVTVTRDLRITVVDDGPGAHGHVPGHGLTGIRERVGMYDGEFSAGPRPEGGFAVSAHLPLEAAR